MSDFKKRLDEAAREAQALAASASKAEHWSRDTLNEFADWIRSTHKGRVYASVESGPVMKVSRLVFSPWTRLNDKVMLFSLVEEDRYARSLGAGEPVFASRDDLEAHLANMVKSPEFQETLSVLASTNADPVEGFLRQGHPTDRDPQYDVFVRVQPDMQKAIGDIFRSKQPADLERIEVEWLGESPIARGDLGMEATSIKWLVSGGMIVEVKQPLTIHGKLAAFSGRVRPDLVESD